MLKQTFIPFQIIRNRVFLDFQGTQLQQITRLTRVAITRPLTATPYYDTSLYVSHFKQLIIAHRISFNFYLYSKGCLLIIIDPKFVVAIILTRFHFLPKLFFLFVEKHVICYDYYDEKDLRGYSSTSELFRLPEWWEEILASGQGSSRERSPVGSRFSELLFLDVPGTATEQVRTCGFRRKSSSLDRAPKIRDSVRLNSFERFLVTLPSISSESWGMYSWAISGSGVFCEWLFLVFLSVSLETAANFLLFLKIAMILREKFCQQCRLNWSFIFIVQSDDPLLLWGERVSINANSRWFYKKVQYQKATIYIIIMVLSFLLFIPFLGGNIIVYTPNQGTKRENYFYQIFYKGKNADFGGK